MFVSWNVTMRDYYLKKSSSLTVKDLLESGAKQISCAHRTYLIIIVTCNGHYSISSGMSMSIDYVILTRLLVSF